MLDTSTTPEHSADTLMAAFQPAPRTKKAQ